MRIIDHLVYSVPDLEQAINDLEQRLGVRPVVGGRHLTRGTKNALLNLGKSCYLEILAVDETNTEVIAPRWMGIDFIDQPQLTRWCLKSNELEQESAILQQQQADLGQIWDGERQLKNGDFLRWKMIVPLASPTVDVVPFMCDWSQSAIHPTEQLAAECQLIEMRFYHPQATEIQIVFNQLNINYSIENATTARIEADIKCPNGVITI